MTAAKMQTNNVAEAFSIYAEDYDRWFDDPSGRMLFELEVDAIRLLMKDVIPPFLEIGVGSGRFAAALGIRYGIEPSEALIEIAEKRGVKVEKAFGEKLPFPKGIFGGVFILFTLCFVKEPAIVLSEAKRVLREDGRIIVGIINRESPWGRFYSDKAARGHPIYKLARFYNVAEVTGLIENAGFSIEALSSTLYQQPTGEPFKEPARPGLSGEAGFVCILAIKEHAGIIR